MSQAIKFLTILLVPILSSTTLAEIRAIEIDLRLSTYKQECYMTSRELKDLVKSPNGWYEKYKNSLTKSVKTDFYEDGRTAQASCSLALENKELNNIKVRYCALNSVSFGPSGRVSQSCTTRITKDGFSFQHIITAPPADFTNGVDDTCDFICLLE